jgi:hypothetical protein
MKLYADFAGRRALQIAADAVAILVITGTVLFAAALHAAIMSLAALGRSIEDAGEGFQETMTEAGESLGNVPVIGGGIRGPFDAAGGAGELLAQAGRVQQDVVASSAILAAIAVAIVPIGLVLWIWLRRRLRFARRATEALALARLDDGEQLLALRALGSASARDLRAISSTPVADWRRGDSAVAHQLAQLELVGAGVRLVPHLPVR